MSPASFTTYICKNQSLEEHAQAVERQYHMRASTCTTLHICKLSFKEFLELTAYQKDQAFEGSCAR